MEQPRALYVRQGHSVYPRRKQIRFRMICILCFQTEKPLRGPKADELEPFELHRNEHPSQDKRLCIQVQVMP